MFISFMNGIFQYIYGCAVYRYEDLFLEECDTYLTNMICDQLVYLSDIIPTHFDYNFDSALMSRNKIVPKLSSIPIIEGEQQRKWLRTKYVDQKVFLRRLPTGVSFLHHKSDKIDIPLRCWHGVDIQYAGTFDGQSRNKGHRQTAQQQYFVKTYCLYCPINRMSRSNARDFCSSMRAAVQHFNWARGFSPAYPPPKLTPLGEQQITQIRSQTGIALQRLMRMLYQVNEFGQPFIIHLSYQVLHSKSKMVTNLELSKFKMAKQYRESLLYHVKFEYCKRINAYLQSQILSSDNVWGDCDLNCPHCEVTEGYLLEQDFDNTAKTDHFIARYEGLFCT
uniref:Uncharacterized protein n=1 Tax=Rhizoctonia cerealis hypovirus TaxID=3068667 RepID=A0AA51BS97_9VIRU|nr:MAG: hypothetical protein [Rhizoctonia cerealis hypovirus]